MQNDPLTLGLFTSNDLGFMEVETLTAEQSSEVMHPTKGASRAIRVAFVMHVMQVAGAEVLVARIIRDLGDRINPVIICLDRIGELGERLQAQGVEVLCLDRKPGRDWSLVGRMAQVLREKRIEVIHAHQYTPFFYSSLARSWGSRGSKLIFTEQS